jgi:beta-aspartyl-peptidase (threonine type)
VLKKRGSSLDAVCLAVKMLENSALFNAGYGSVLNHKGKIELDAAIMDGESLKAGSVAGVSRIRNPVLAALEVMNSSKHVMLIGKHAEHFARRHGIKFIDPESLITAAQFKKWQAFKIKKNQEIEKHGTVGAVAMDYHGNLAAATSTGGIMNKMPGRVGDSPIIGAGTYADNQTCAVSATGQGEYFIRTVFCYDIAAQLRYKKISLKKAGQSSLQRLEELGGQGGFIAIDNQGNIEINFNTQAMHCGYVDQTGINIK